MCTCAGPGDEGSLQRRPANHRHPRPPWQHTLHHHPEQGAVQGPYLLLPQGHLSRAF